MEYFAISNYFLSWLCNVFWPVH